MSSVPSIEASLPPEALAPAPPGVGPPLAGPSPPLADPMPTSVLSTRSPARLPLAGLAALSLGHLAVDACTGIWPVYKTLAHLDLAKAGLVATAGSMLGNGLQIGFGIAADRGWTRTLLVGGLVLAGSTALLPLVESWPAMFGLVLATFVGSAAFHPAGAGAAGAISRQRTGVAVALFLTGGYVGYAFSQTLFTAVWRAAPGLTWLMALVPLIAAAALAFTLKPSTRPRTGLRASLAAAKTAVRPLSALFAIQVFTTAASLGLIFLLPDLMLARHQPEWLVQGGAHAALVLGACAILVPAGHLADRIGARTVLRAGNLGTLVLGAVLLASDPGPIGTLLLIAAVGACNGVNTVVAVAEGNRLLPGQAAAASALLMGMPWCVAALAPAVAGHLADPAQGGTPVLALAWIGGVSLPLALAAGMAVGRKEQGETA